MDNVAWIINAHGCLVDVPADRLEDTLGLVDGCRLATDDEVAAGGAASDSGPVPEADDGEPEPDPPASAETVDGDVPDGNIADILDWVGDDPTRAQMALDVEQAGKARSSLIGQLSAVIDG